MAKERDTFAVAWSQEEMIFLAAAYDKIDGMVEQFNRYGEFEKISLDRVNEVSTSRPSVFIVEDDASDMLSVNGIIKVPNYGGIETDIYGGEKSPLMALMIFTSMTDYWI